MRERLPALLRLVVSLVLIAVLLRQVDSEDVLNVLRRAGSRSGFVLAVVALLLYAAAIASNALKWRVLLEAQGVRVPFSSLLRHTFVGVFFNNFLPVIGADVVRGYGLARETSQGSGVAVSVLVDRLVGFLVFTSAGTMAAVFARRWAGLGAGEHSGALAAVERVGLLATVALLAGFLILLSGRVRTLVTTLITRIPLVRGAGPLVLGLSDSVAAYRTQPGALVTAYTIGLTTVLLSNVVNWLLFAALEIGIRPIYVFIFNPIIGLVTALPISVGGLGLNQNVFPALYGLVGVFTADAVAVSVVLQLIILLTSLPGGVVWAATRSQRPDAPAPVRPVVARPSDR
ncbi:MAG TPA: lysylphosphatidylglycerol synthase transmembrane domain-containing protein [Ardenticatenaceae bacterium]|nr:lysylphosphatidylglycerol synthase transmembrane domain-containing protein [Ardenticatenaceae bacterium]